MIETIIAILFLLGIVLVALGPKPSDKKGKDLETSSPPATKDPDAPEKNKGGDGSQD
ncbi:MAG TPA: hypothetical protein VEC95_06585 [Terriglobales bacterium]|nr:hypothetical protein [Terriglobales bacterium]